VEIETSTGKQMVWVLIDLDASCEIGTPAGQKITSSAFYPPEMARQELMKQAPPTHAADLTAVAAEKQAQLDAAMQRRENEVVASLTSELKQLEAELKHVAGTAQAEPIHASIQFEMWYFGCLLYQLSTEDGMMLWDANQADNIDDRQLRQLAYQWADVKDDKLQKIIWPQAEHLASLLLSEHAQHRPSTWDQVMQHPFLAREGESAPLKRVVMSCPEMGTISADGVSGPYNQQVMDKVSELQQIGYLKFGFDRQGTSTAREQDSSKFEEASALRKEGKNDEAVALLKATDWWYGYQTSVKQAVKLESQSFDGELEIICIRGGPITALEAAEMPRIMAEAQSDCARSSVTVKYTITEMSYYDFLLEFDPVATEPEQLKPPARLGEELTDEFAGKSADDVERQMIGATAVDEGVPPADLDQSEQQHAFEETPGQAGARLQKELAATVARLQKELAAKDEELAAKDEELATLRAAQSVAQAS
jgi:hypothetical protein